MSDRLLPILIFAAKDDPKATTLVELLTAQGVDGIVVTHASHGFIRLCTSTPSDPRIRAVIGLSKVPGMTMPVLAKSIRSMPDLAQLPLLMVGADSLSLPRCLSLDSEVDLQVLVRFALQEPECWPTTSIPPQTQNLPSAISAKVILVVDDHEVNLHLVSAQLREVNLPIETCTNGAAAVARVLAGGVVLVLMDCQMPIMDGYTATREIRAQEQGTTRHLPIIAVTAHAMNENRQQCLDAGMDDFLSKPVEQEQLVKTVRQWLDSIQSVAAAPIATIPAPIPVVFNSQQLHSLQHSAPDLCHRIIAVIRDELITAQHMLPQLLSNRDLPSLNKAAHKLKGAAANVGAVEVARVCGALESAARDGDHAAAVHLVATIQDAIIRLRPYLTDFLASTPAQSVNKPPT